MNATTSGTKRQGFWVLSATILASATAFIDITALNVALPALQKDLNASGADLLWIVNAYAILLASLLLVGGSLSDRYGHKRVFMLGIILFAGASLLCGLAPNTMLLIAARAVQGIGGALMVPGSLTLITVTFDDSCARAAIGTWSSVTTLFIILGPVLGGLLAGQGLWRGVFFINLPLAAIALWVLWFHIPESIGATYGLDVPGAILATLGLGGITYGFIQLPGQGISDPLVVIGLLGGVIAIMGFVLVEARSPHPMMPLSLFKQRTFTGTNLATLFLYSALNIANFMVPLNLIQVQGYTPALTSLTYFVPFAILLTLLSHYAGSWLDRSGARLPLTLGPTITGIGLFLFSLPGLTNGLGDYWTTYFPAVLALGIGMGITVAPLTTAVMGAVSQENAGIASGINNAVARTAGVLAVAIIGGLALFVFRDGLAARADTLQLDSETKTELVAEANKFGDAQAPASIPEARHAAIALQIKLAFVDAFRVTALTGAVLAWLAAVLAFFTVPGKFTL